jgi:RNA polymerase sigma factor (sigma-70 family)
MFDKEAGVRTTEMLQSDESTMELVIKAQSGDVAALEALIERSLPQLRRWAHGRLSQTARGYLDTNDVIQDAVFQLLRRVPVFVPRHVGAMQAFLRRTITNRIYDEMRRIARQPRPIALDDDHPFNGISPQEAAIRAETYQRYRDTLPRLRPRDRALVIARIELQWSFVEIARRFGTTDAAARMATKRALRRFETQMKTQDR